MYDATREWSCGRNAKEESTEKEQSASSSRTMWGDRYLKRIMANISVRIDSLIIRYTHKDLHCVLTSKAGAVRRSDM